jgi:hypothetical protein
MTGNNKIECDLEIKQTKALEKTIASDLKQKDKPIEEILKYERKESDNTRTTQNN